MKNISNEKFNIENFSDLKIFCQYLVARLQDKSVLLFYGPLGAGKTKTIEFLMRELGSEEVSSPTFTLHQEYKTGRFLVDHFDLYRIENAEDLESSGFWDAFAKPQGLVIVEWAEKLDISHLPKSWKAFKIEIQIKNDLREITLTRLFE